MIDAKVRPGGRIVWNRDATANDSDKSFTVPTGKIWEMQFILAQITTTATVGNRYVVITITNGADGVWTSHAAGAVAASKTGIICLSSGNTLFTTVGRLISNSASTADAASYEYLPPLLLPEGYVIRIWDSAAIDAAADDMITVLHYIEYDA